MELVALGVRLSHWHGDGLALSGQNHFPMLRTITLPVIALLASTTLLHAQEFRFGAGYIGSNVQKAGNEKWVGKAGYQGGVDLVLGQQFFIRPGAYFQVRNLNYTVAGLDAQGAVVGSDVEYRYTSRSLRVPLFAGLRFIAPEDSEFNIYVAAGPTALFNLSADLDNDQLEVETSGTQWFLGGAAGMELGFLFVEAGYDVAMSDVFKGDRFSTNPRVNQLSVTAGVRLRLAQ